MPEGSLKALLKLGRDLNNITNEKLETMNSKNLLPYHVQRFELYKYTAKYNALSDERKIAQKIRLAKDLNTIIKKTDVNNTDELLVLSVAIYTKQLDIARNILNNIPNNDIAIYKSLNLSTLAAFPDPNSIIYNANTLKKEEITEVLNAASISLMAEDAKEFVSKNAQKVLQNVEKVLEDAPQNEETLEIGINAALLNNDINKAKEYANQLSKEKQEEIFTNDFGEVNDAEDLDQLFKQYDAKKFISIISLKKTTASYIKS